MGPQDWELLVEAGVTILKMLFTFALFVYFVWGWGSEHMGTTAHVWRSEGL